MAAEPLRPLVELGARPTRGIGIHIGDVGSEWQVTVFRLPWTLWVISSSEDCVTEIPGIDSDVWPEAEAIGWGSVSFPVTG
jgi:hypothetical protein